MIKKKFLWWNVESDHRVTEVFAQDIADAVSQACAEEDIIVDRPYTLLFQSHDNEISSFDIK